MKVLILSSCFLFLLNQAVYGLLLGKFFHGESSQQVSTSKELSTQDSEDSNVYNSTSEYRLEQIYSSSGSNQGSEPLSTDTSHFESADDSIKEMRSESVMSTSSSQRIENLTEILSNETFSNSFTISSDFSKEVSSSSSSFVTSERTPTSKSSTLSSKISSSVPNASSSISDDDDEPEGVVIGKPIITANGTTATSEEKTLYHRTLEIISDTYTLSILVPVAAGVVFATTIILTIATCRCIKKRCRRRRLRSKVLPDSVKNLRPSDRARLLAETSDEEF